MVLESSGPTSLPVDKPVSIGSLLSGYVELSHWQPAATRDARTFAPVESSETTKAALAEVLSEYSEHWQVLAKRLSILDNPARYPELPPPAYLDMFPFTCGTRRVAQGIHKVLSDLVEEARGFSDEQGTSAAFTRTLRTRVPVLDTTSQWPRDDSICSPSART